MTRFGIVFVALVLLCLTFGQSVGQTKVDGTKPNTLAERLVAGKYVFLYDDTAERFRITVATARQYSESLELGKKYRDEMAPYLAGQNQLLKQLAAARTEGNNEKVSAIFKSLRTLEKEKPALEKPRVVYNVVVAGKDYIELQREDAMSQLIPTHAISVVSIPVAESVEQQH